MNSNETFRCSFEDDLKSVQAEKEKQRFYEKFYANDDDMLAERLEANGKSSSDEIKAPEGVANQLRAKLSIKERTRKVVRL